MFFITSMILVAFVAFSQCSFLLLDPIVDNSYQCGETITQQAQFTDYPAGGIEFHLRSNETSGKWNFEYKPVFV
jgi:hypothetical protein